MDGFYDVLLVRLACVDRVTTLVCGMNLLVFGGGAARGKFNFEVSVREIFIRIERPHIKWQMSQ